MEKAFSLLELLLVVVIVAIFASWGVPNFVVSKEYVADKNAIQNLKIMQAAQKSYALYAATYFSSTDISAINRNLSVSLPSGATRDWNFTTYSSGCVQAMRNGNNNRYWNLTMINATNNNTDPSNALVCP